MFTFVIVFAFLLSRFAFLQHLAALPPQCACQFPRAAVTNRYSLGGVGEQTSSHSFGGWKYQSGGRASLSLKTLRKDPSLPLPGFGGCRQSLVPLGGSGSTLISASVSSLLLCESPNLPSPLQTPVIGLGPSSVTMTSSQLDDICKDPISKGHTHRA